MHLSRSDKVLLWVLAGFFVLGYWLGHGLATVYKLESAKLLNIVGLTYNFFGIAVLSEILSSSQRWRRISVEIVAPTVLWAHTTVPLGAFLGAVLANGPSAAIISRFAIGFWGYSLLPLMLLNETVVFPQIANLRELESRWRYFSFYLLLSGVGIQLLAAVLEI